MLSSPMKLYTSPTSPYARKVRVVLTEKKIECEFVDADPWIAETTIPQFNPLGKIPVLILDDGTELYDSRDIVEYLDTVSPVSRLIADVPEPGQTHGQAGEAAVIRGNGPAVAVATKAPA